MVGLLRALSRSLFSRIYSNPHSAVIRVSQGSRSLYSTLQFSDCGEINKNHIGKEIQLRGWVQSHRPLGGLLFILLRDYTGTVQLVWSPEKTADNSTDPEGNIKVATSDYSLESIIQVKGRVRSRPESMINPKMVNGDVEVLVLEQKLINKSDILPYVLFGANNITEETRLKYRYLDLRRPEVQKNILLRSRVSHLIRSHLVDEGFAEIETPTLTKSTPEGAREFLVATRSPGHFYALPQSPQQYKQLLMASGFQKYFQIARCYRDEGNRADRQPEFTQVDLEMAFVSDRDVMNCMENLIRRIWKATVFSKVCDADFEKKVQFPILSYMQAIRSYGSDKPDTRYDICIRDITSTSKSTTFSPFLEAIEAMGTVKSVCIPKLGKIMSNAQVKELIDEAKKLKEGTKGHIFTAKVEPGARLKSSMTKFIPEAIQREICLQHEAKDEDIIFFTCGSEIPACITLGRIRLLAANILRKHELLLVPKDTYNFLWVTDFPLFEVDDDRVLDDGKISALSPDVQIIISFFLLG
eukprot:TRINITY_DN2792_c0_g1_i7.p1 TRINITY_DN2792_c0_g1~~TRINITY_DN2792_c0_g1_i7.p1  ORF type:complete len:526 (+),score=86.67 TRINITY_DN2792_c0_g1_i7:45-1622(+)